MHYDLKEFSNNAVLATVKLNKLYKSANGVCANVEPTRLTNLFAPFPEVISNKKRNKCK
jgi:hypothetical protein